MGKAQLSDFIHSATRSPIMMQVRLKQKREHSRKLDEFYQILCEHTVGRRLDMYNRRRIEGFVPWGNQAPKAKAPQHRLI
jgi:N6-adenosine-specific RNA methylase IME4